MNVCLPKDEYCAHARSWPSHTRWAPYDYVVLFGRKQKPAPALTAPTAEQLPEILISALKGSELESFVIAPGDHIIFQTDGVTQLSLSRDNRLINDELLNVVRQMRRDGINKRENLETAIGPVGSGKRSLHVTASRLNDANWIIVYIVDESEQKRIEAVRRDFVANVSHELKTPIGAISLLSEAILGAKDDPEAVARFASRMQTEAERLTSLVQEIINLSRLQAEDSLGEAELVPVDKIISEAIFQTQPIADARKIEISAKNDLQCIVRGNRSQLVMAIHNLIENAVNYSPDRTKVSVSTQVVDGIVEIRVTDQGIGIAESEQDRIFERFYRVDPARSRETGGTGLGLSIVKHIAQNHGGEVTVWSRPNVGSTFALRLPLVESTSEKKIQGRSIDERINNS